MVGRQDSNLRSHEVADLQLSEILEKSITYPRDLGRHRTKTDIRRTDCGAIEFRSLGLAAVHPGPIAELMEHVCPDHPHAAHHAAQRRRSEGPRQRFVAGAWAAWPISPLAGAARCGRRATARRTPLREAGEYIHSLPEDEQHKPHWEAATEAPLLVVRTGGDTLLARIGMVRALNHGKPVAPSTPRKKPAKRYRIIR